MDPNAQVLIITSDKHFTLLRHFFLPQTSTRPQGKLEVFMFIPCHVLSMFIVINCCEKSLGSESLNSYSYPFCPDGPQRPGIRAAAVRGRPGTVSGASPIPAISGNSHSSHPSLSTMSNVDRLQWQVGELAQFNSVGFAKSRIRVCFYKHTIKVCACS